MDQKTLKEKIKLFYNESIAYRQRHAFWFQEVEDILHGNDISNIYTQLSRLYSEKNARQGRLSLNNKVSDKDLIKRYKVRMSENLARFQSSFGKSLVTAASAARGGVVEHYVHNIAGDTQAGDYTTEVINDIIANDRTLKKLPRFAGEIFKYNSAILVVDEYRVKGSVLKFRTKLYSGKRVLYDPQSNEEDIQTSRFVGIDGFTYTKDMLQRMKMETDKGYVIEGIDELIRRLAGGEDRESEIPMVQMYIYDEEANKVHHVIFDEQEKTIIKQTFEDTVVAGGREIRFNIVGGVRNSEEYSKHYTKSDFYTQIPVLKSRVTLLIDILSVVSQVRANVTMVHPNAFKSVLKAFVEGFPIAQGSPTTSPGVPIQNQMTTLDQPNLNGLQSVLNQFEGLFSTLFPENTPELRGAVEEKLKSVYEGNVSVIKKIIDANSPLETSLRDLFLIIVRVIAQTPSHEFLIRSTSLGGFSLNRMLSSKLLRQSKQGGIVGVPVDIRPVVGDQSDFIMKKDFVAQVLSTAQTGGVNIRNFSKWIARNSNRVFARLTPDDLYIIYSPYEDTVVRQVLNDIKMVAIGENVIYPEAIVGSDYMQTLQQCLKEKAASYIKSNGDFTTEGERVYNFALRMLERFAQSQAENSPAFQERELNAQEQEQEFREPNPEGLADAAKGIFANQVTTPEAE